MDPYLQALLDTIAGTESPGYNVMYGGRKFGSYADHPRQLFPITSGPNRGEKSSAAGRYQFLKGTWDEEKRRLGLPDFSPQSQDLAAADLAQRTYGGNLQGALRSGDPRQIAQVGQKLSGRWTSLPGGIEAGTNNNRFANAYNRNLASLSNQSGLVPGAAPMRDVPLPQPKPPPPLMAQAPPQQLPHPDFARPPQPGPSPFQGPPPMLAGAGSPSMPPPFRPPGLMNPPAPTGFAATSAAPPGFSMSGASAPGVGPGIAATAPSVGGPTIGGIFGALAGLGNALNPAADPQAAQAAQQANDEAARRRLEWARANGFTQA